MPITPFAQLAKLLHFLVVMLQIVFDWEALRVVHSNIAAQAE
jgi:hypothetical protein